MESDLCPSSRYPSFNYTFPWVRFYLVCDIFNLESQISVMTLIALEQALILILFNQSLPNHARYHPYHYSCHCQIVHQLLNLAKPNTKFTQRPVKTAIALLLVQTPSSLNPHTIAPIGQKNPNTLPQNISSSAVPSASSSKPPPPPPLLPPPNPAPGPSSFAEESSHRSSSANRTSP